RVSGAVAGPCRRPQASRSPGRARTARTKPANEGSRARVPGGPAGLPKPTTELTASTQNGQRRATRPHPRAVKGKTPAVDGTTKGTNPGTERASPGNEPRQLTRSDRVRRR